jgi:drug/metabolite transporter (DMT)-like permease
MTMGGAALGYVVIALVIGQFGDLGAPLVSSEALLPVLTAGLVGAAIPTLCFITGIRLLGAPRAAILATLEPVIGVGLAAWLLNEQPATLQLVGGALILIAAVLLQLGGGTASEHEAVA